MKMEYILQEDGTFRFDAPDAIAAFARDHGMRLFGHTLVWYAAERPPPSSASTARARSSPTPIATTSSPSPAAIGARPWPGTWSTRR